MDLYDICIMCHIRNLVARMHAVIFLCKKKIVSENKKVLKFQPQVGLGSKIEIRTAAN